MSRRSPRLPSHESERFQPFPSEHGWDRRAVLAVLWLAGFLIYFSSSVLPNNSQFSRIDLWLYLPEYFSTYLKSPELPGAPNSGWRYFPQRFDLIATASILFAASFSLGRLTLRTIRLPQDGPLVEQLVLSAGVGLSLLSLITLAVGVIGWLSQASIAVILLLAVLLDVLPSMIRRHRTVPETAGAKSGEIGKSAIVPSQVDVERSPRIVILSGLVAAPFLLAMVLGAMLPDSDFDVREYHLQGPKEYFEAGRISYLPHNVYTSFPFLTEMLSLAAMTLRGDWYRGALAGKLLLMMFAPLTGMAVFAVARRLAGLPAGCIAAIIHLSTPWTYRISIIAYAEGGLTFFLAASTLAALLVNPSITSVARRNGILLTGFLAGSAMACKYTGLVSVVIPIGLYVVWQRRTEVRRTSEGTRKALMAAAWYALGVFLAVGPWLVKNLIETGNPVSPLAWSIFGGRDWDAAMNAKWKAAHSPPDFDLTKLGFWLTDVSARNDWLSPLLYGLAPLAAFAFAHRRTIGVLWVFIGYLFVTWWLLTHRLDRFWVPMLPIVAMLAGIGATAVEDRLWRWFRNAVMASCLAFNLCLVTSPLSGPNGYLVDLQAARSQIAGPSISSLNAKLPPGSRVLCVGEAGVFDFTVPVVYNTVFDRSIFQEWTSRKNADGTWSLRETDDILNQLRENQITHVFVNWAEILRYRTTYGYAESATPERFDQLEQLGILGEAVVLGLQPFPADDVRARREMSEWGAALKSGFVPSPAGPVPSWKSQLVYKVLDE